MCNTADREEGGGSFRMADLLELIFIYFLILIVLKDRKGGD